MAIEGPKIDIRRLPISWAQSLIGHGTATGEVSSPVPPEEGRKESVDQESPWEDLEEEDVFLSPDPNPRLYPHSNRRSERVARQKRDLERRQDKTPVREYLKDRRRGRTVMPGVKHTPNKAKQAPQGQGAPSTSSTIPPTQETPMETNPRYLWTR